MNKTIWKINKKFKNAFNHTFNKTNRFKPVTAKVNGKFRTYIEVGIFLLSLVHKSNEFNKLITLLGNLYEYY